MSVADVFTSVLRKDTISSIKYCTFSNPSHTRSMIDTNQTGLDASPMRMIVLSRSPDYVQTAVNGI